MNKYFKTFVSYLYLITCLLLHRKFGNTLNVTLCNLQLNKLKSGIKNGTEVTLKLLSNLIRNSNYEINFLHKLLLTDTQDSRLRIAFANGSSPNIKFSKTQLSKIIQLGRGFFFFYKFFAKSNSKNK